MLLMMRVQRVWTSISLEQPVTLVKPMDSTNANCAMVWPQLLARPPIHRFAMIPKSHARSRSDPSTREALWSIDTTLDARPLPPVTSRRPETSTPTRCTTSAAHPKWHLDFSNNRNVPFAPRWAHRLVARSTLFSLEVLLPLPRSTLARLDQKTSLLCSPILKMLMMVSMASSPRTTGTENFVLLCNFVINLFQTMRFFVWHSTWFVARSTAHDEDGDKWRLKIQNGQRFTWTPIVWRFNAKFSREMYFEIGQLRV